ncbi:MAG: HD-GYP domain-containing protein, partial [bacterium]
GSGYPQSVDSGNLTLPENILIVTDVYDAMSTTRPHRPAISPDKIITYLKNRTEKFDEEIISVLENYIGPYPPGTVVQLNSNEIGVAMAGGNDPDNPRVKVIIDSKGTVYDDPEVIDLEASTEKRIVETVGTRNTPSALLKFISD